jgi:HTH-type transcriptional regulator / antitoxin PezA
MPKLRTSNIDKVIGERIRRERKRQDLTLDDVAKHAGISLQMLAHHEGGRTNITVVRLLMIARALKKPIMFFIGGRQQ